MTCGTETEALKTAHEAARRELSGLQDKRRELEDRRSRATDEAERAKLTTEIDATEKQLDALEAALDAHRANLDRRKDFVQKVIDTLGRCLDYRNAVMNVFAYATDKVQGEPEPEIRPLALQLRDRYPEAISGHAKQIETKTNSVKHCNKELP